MAQVPSATEHSLQLGCEAVFGAALLEEVASVYFLSLRSEFGDSGAGCPVVPTQRTGRAMLQAAHPRANGSVPGVSTDGRGVKGLQRPPHHAGTGAQAGFALPEQPPRGCAAWQGPLAVAE